MLVMRWEKTLLVFYLDPTLAQCRQIHGDVEKETVGFLTCSQRWPNVAYATATMPTIANVGPTSVC